MKFLSVHLNRNRYSSWFLTSNAAKFLQSIYVVFGFVSQIPSKLYIYKLHWIREQPFNMITRLQYDYTEYN